MSNQESDVIKSPLNFGSEVDFHLAIQELKWLRTIKGKITNSNYQKISEKYLFPVDFLKQGVSGLKFPDDYQMHKSKWFPIFYSWAIHNHEKFLNLLKITIDYEKSRINSIIVPFFIVLFFGGVALVFHRNDVANLAEVILLGVVLASIGLYVEYSNNVKGKKVNLEEVKRHLIMMGQEKIIDEVEEFSRNYGKYLAVAEDIVYKKLEESKKLQLFPGGYEIDEEGNTFPVNSEDIELIYYERMKEIMNN